MGKSLPAILYSVQRVHSEKANILIIAPSSLVQNWAIEFEKWIMKLNLKSILIVKLEGNKRLKNLISWKSEGGVLISTVLRILNLKDHPEEWHQFCEVKIHSTIVDEAHDIISGSKCSLQLFDLLSCKRRLLLTGTPLLGDGYQFTQMVKQISSEFYFESSSYVSEFIKGNTLPFDWTQQLMKDAEKLHAMNFISKKWSQITVIFFIVVANFSREFNNFSQL